MAGRLRTLLQANQRIAGIIVAAAALLLLQPVIGKAATSGCTAQTNDFGKVSFSATNPTPNAILVPATGTYNIWLRMAAPAPASTDNTVFLDVDGSNCFTFGGSQVPTYASGDSSYFKTTNAASYGNQNGADNQNWINTTGNGTTNSDNTLNASTTRVSMSLTAGLHNFTLIGAAQGVVVDRIELVQENTCVPDNTAVNNYGDDCAVPPDTTDPIVNVTTINGNDVTHSQVPSVSSPLSITVSAQDNSGVVSKVDLYIDGSPTPTQSDNSPPFTFTGLNLAPGPHTAQATAYDPSNNSSNSTQVSFTVLDTTNPTVSITAPANNSTQSGTIAVQATAADNVGVTQTELYVDGNLLTPDGSPPYSFSLDTTSLSNGSHTLMVKAYDAAQNTQTSSITITVNNVSQPGDTTPPTISITKPSANSIIAGRAYVFAPVITDASGIKQVVFQVDGTTKLTDITAPFSYTLDTSSLAPGVHTFGVKATDNSPSQNVNPTFTTVSIRVTTFADVDRNCIVNFSDMSQTLALRGSTNYTGAPDVDGNGIVNFSDLSPILTARGTQPC